MLKNSRVCMNIVGAATLFIAFAEHANAQWFRSEPWKCGDSSTVGLIKKHFETDILKQLNSNPFTQISGLQANVTNMRESQRYESSIKKRFCKANISIKFLGANDFLKFGLALNGFNSDTGTVDSIVDYTVQLLEDGTNFVEMQN